MQLSFSHRKAVQALNFFAVAAGGSMNKMKALKLIYFADRHHLRKYGRPITNDSYFAMKFGPVASACLNLLNENDEFTAPEENEYRSQFLSRLEEHDFSSVSAVDASVLSESDLDALKFAWKNYRQMDQFQLAVETHRFPEWRQHQAALESGQATRRQMYYSDFLQNPEEGVDKAPALKEEDIADLREELAELHAVETLWS
ncbi:MAG: Panacea domain-containing protein [Verrucomicrobia bacterium]|nr:Panacea domain-containing protein [Verrucomicrobiota bacterium]